MNLRKGLIAKIISIVILFFFLWSSGGIFNLAYAATSDKSQSVKESKGQRKEKTTEEKFQETLERIKDGVDKEDASKLKTERAEIETLDVDIKKQFKATEDKIKDLPQEIKQRHRNFIKKYEENLNTLKTNLDAIDKAKTTEEKKQALQKNKDFLEKTKQPSKHVPLDPNKLPHRIVEPKFKEPRIKKEDFDKEFGQQKAQIPPNPPLLKGGIGEISPLLKGDNKITPSAKSLPLPPFEKGGKGGFAKPILVASNGPLTGLLSPNSDLLNPPLPSVGEGWGEGATPYSLGINPNATSLDSLSPNTYDLKPVLLAQATNLPTPADLSETIEVQFTDDIKAKAAELGNNPVKIYEWVRNNIEFVPTYGSIQGADMCLQTKQCNDFDTASLLIALLRTSNISARYVYGTIELPIDKVMNWVGGFTDAKSAVNFIASGGVPIKAYTSGGKIAKVQMEHVWVKAFVDYIPSIGAVHKQGDTWIPLDASFKQHTYTSGIDFQTAVPFDGQTLADQIKATATINEQESYATNIDATLIQTTLSNYNKSLEDYVNTNIPNATVDDVLGKKEIIKKEQLILPSSLPYKTVIINAETSELSNQLRHKITIQITNADIFGGTGFTYTASLPQLAGKKITIGYDPATTTDLNTINKYAEQFATSIPAYLIQLKPVLRIENTAIVTGEATGMGTPQFLNITITSPKGTEIITHNLSAGDYTAVGLNPSKINLDVLQKRIDKNDFTEAVGEMLHQTVLSYWAEVDAFNHILAKTFKVIILRHPSEMTATAKVSITYLYGAPISATYKSRNIDVKFDNQSVMSQSGEKTKEFSYMQQSGTTSSFLEGAVYDQLFGKNIGDSASAITILNQANGQGIPIYRIDSTNIATVLPKLQISNEVKNEISNAIHAGLTVQIPQTEVTHLGWTGAGYIIINPTDGSGAYRISGGLNGMDGAAEGETVIALPVEPLAGPAVFVVGALATNAGVSLRAMAGPAVVEGIEIIIGGAAAMLAAKILVIMMLIILIVTLIQQMPALYRTFRHYTIEAAAQAIWTTNEIITDAGWFDGDLWVPGIYVTDLTIEPVTEYNRTQIATMLRMPNNGPPDPNRVTAYVEMLIDRNRVPLISFRLLFPHQYLYPYPVMWNDGVRIKFIKIGPFLSMP